MNEKIEEYRFDDACSAIYAFVYEQVLLAGSLRFLKPFLISEEEISKSQRIEVLKYAFQNIIFIAASLLFPL